MSDYSEPFKCKNGIVVTIEIDDSSYTATALDSKRREIGRIEFWEQEGSLKIVWMHLNLLGDRYLRQGIGRRCLQIIAKRFGLEIFAEENDGLRKDDGSHLTGDAPAFVAKMRTEGLVVPGPFDDDPWRDE